MYYNKDSNLLTAICPGVFNAIHCILVTFIVIKELAFSNSKFDCPEVTLCGSQDVKIQFLILKFKPNVTCWVHGIGEQKKTFVIEGSVGLILS